MYGTLPYVAYASLYIDVPHSVCLFSHFFFIFEGSGFDDTNTSDIIIGI